MAFADEQSYEEMISALQNYASQVEEECNVMEAAGEDCVDNTDGDPAAEKCSSKLQICTSNIRAATQTILAIAAALQQQMEEIRENAARANQID